MMTHRTLIAATLLLGSLAFGSAAHATDLSGYWAGGWNSCNTGHKGVLKADFCRISPTAYQVNFKGRFFKVFPFRYSVVLNVVSDDGQTVRLQGSSYLGRIFGTFYYTASVTDGCFNASYTSCKDAGSFRMTKCCD
jgi:hypothetical protein